MAEVSGDLAQRDDGIEALGPAGGLVDGATEAAAFLDFQYTGAAGTPCTEDSAAVGHDRAANYRLAGSRDTDLESGSHSFCMGRCQIRSAYT